MERCFLVQRHDYYDDTYFSSIMNCDELIAYIDMSDCYNEDWKIYEITEFGKVIPIHYVGWQPNCLIEFANDDNEVVLSGYGTDH